jgi:glycosyltransferase involved in cell wall biosynthesis
MKVLVLTPWPIAPLSHGGRVRTFRLAAGLARCGASVDVACPWGPGQPRGEHRIEDVRIRPQLFPAMPLLPLSDDLLPSDVPIAWQARLPGFRPGGDYDVVQAAAPGFAPWLERLPAGVLRVYGSANVEHDFAHRRAAEFGRLRRRLARRVADLERRVIATSDLVFACTERDARRFDELYGTSDVAVVPNGFDDDLLRLDRAGLREEARAELGVAKDQRLVVFIGGGADHNRRAVEFLERELAPRLDKSVRLLVAGKAAGGLSEGDGRVLSLGFVDDVRPLLAAADVAVNPVSYGSGSNLKVAEYLATGLPVVTTPIGARGFERWSDRMHVVELDRFAEAIAGSEPPGAPPPGIDELGWNHIAERLHELYSRLIA